MKGIDQDRLHRGAVAAEAIQLRCPQCGRGENLSIDEFVALGRWPRCLHCGVRQDIVVFKPRELDA